MASRAPRVLLFHPGTLYGAESVVRKVVKTTLVEFFSFLRAHDVDVEVLDLQAEFGNPRPEAVDEYLRVGSDRLLSFDFDVLAVSCWSSHEYLASVEFAERVRAQRPDALIVVGGYHPTAVPADFAYAGTPFDIVVTGEGELALLALLRDGRPRGGDRPPRVVAGTPLPLERIYFDIDDYPYLTPKPAEVGVFLSRGCPYRCTFCMDPQVGRTRWRHLSVELAVELMEKARACDPRRIVIHDACFGYLNAWRHEFLQALVDRGFDLPLWAEMRGDRMTSADLELCEKLDFWLQFGVETMSPRMAEIMRKARTGATYVANVDNTLREVNRRHILAKVFLLLNHPGETGETAEETVSYFERFVAEHEKITVIVNTSKFHYYPGTDTALRRGFYESTYGTRFANLEWYKERTPQFALSQAQRASADLGDITPYVERIQALQPQLVRKMPAAQQLQFLQQLNEIG